MIQNNSKYRNYTFDSEGALGIFLGFIVGNIILLGYIFIIILFSVNIKEIFQNVQLIEMKLKEIATSMSFNIVAYICEMFFPILGFYYFKQKRKGKTLNFNMQSRPFHVYLLIFPLMFGGILIGEFFTNLIPINGGFFGKMYDSFSQALDVISTDIFGMVLLTTFLAPILEEILFRGIIQKGMINNGVKPVIAIVLSSLIFGIIHFNPWQFVGAFLLGMIMGLVYYKTKSLLMPILLHAFNNGLSSYLLATGKTESFGDLLGLHNWQVLLIGIAIFGIFYYLFMYRNRVYFNE